MTIYIDILVITNIIINYFLLLLNINYCSCGIELKRKNIIIASLVGGFYSLVSLLPQLSFFVVFASKLVCCFLMIVILFGTKNLLKNYYCFLMINFIFSGLMMAIWFFICPPAMNVSNGVVYFNISTKTLIISILVAYIIINIFSVLTKKMSIDIQDYLVEIYINTNSVVLKGFVDTGNFLHDVFSSTPVVVCKFDSIKNILPMELQYVIKNGDMNISDDFLFEKCHKYHIRFIPYRTINHQQMMVCFKPQKFILKKDNINNKKNNSININDVYIGVILDNNFIDKNYDIILNPGLIK